MRIPTLSELARSVRSLSFNEWLALLLVLAPAILEVAYIRFFGVNVVSWDQWDFVPYIEKMFQHNLSLSELFSQHNDHRLFFPRIVMLALAYISNYNNLYEMYFSSALTFLALALIFSMYKSDFGTSAKMLMAFIPVSFLMFNLKQYGNILWGFQLQVYLSVIGFIVSIYLLDRSNKFDIKFLLAVFGGVLASYSFANGLAVWPAGLFFILISGKEKIMAAFWSFFGLMTATIYFINWVRPVSNPSTFFILEHPLKGLLYFACNIGSPLGLIIPVASGIGLILIAILFIEVIILAKCDLVAKNAKWLSFILFSLLSSFAMAVFRSGFGIQQALVSRYITITSLAIIGIYLLALSIYNMNSKNKMHRSMMAIILIILFFGLTSGYMYGLIEGPSFSVSRMDDAYHLKTYRLQPDNNLAGLYPDPKIVRQRAPILERYGLNVFAGGYDNMNSGNDLLTDRFYNMHNINNTIQQSVSWYKIMLRGVNKRFV